MKISKYLNILIMKILTLLRYLSIIISRYEDYGNNQNILISKYLHIYIMKILKYFHNQSMKI